MAINLSVNINKPALIRNSRGGNEPNLIKLVKDLEAFGVDGITVHPRPDERHIRYADVEELSSIVQTEFNIEGYPSKNWMDLVLKVKPHQATLVPDPPEALTSDSGWKVSSNKEQLFEIMKELKANGIRSSLFMENDEVEIEAAKSVGADRIELYTGPYAKKYHINRVAGIDAYQTAASFAESIGLGVNAGHDLNQENLPYFLRNIPEVVEVSIGHALWCESIYNGMANTIDSYLKITGKKT